MTVMMVIVIVALLLSLPVVGLSVLYLEIYKLASDMNLQKRNPLNPQSI